MQSWMAPSTRWFLAPLHKLEKPRAPEGSFSELPCTRFDALTVPSPWREGATVQVKGMANRTCNDLRAYK